MSLFNSGLDLALFLDFAYGVDYGGVVLSAEQAADFGQGCVRELLTRYMETWRGRTTFCVLLFSLSCDGLIWKRSATAF